MTHAFRRAFVSIVGVLMFGWVVSGCSGDASQGGVPGAAGTGGQSQAAFVDLQIALPFITVQNRAGHPLVDLQVAIKPAGGPLLYTTRIPRLESGDKMDLSLGDFRSKDGTQFSLRVARPKEMIVTAVDVVGKKYEMTMPWKG